MEQKECEYNYVLDKTHDKRVDIGGQLDNYRAEYGVCHCTKCLQIKEKYLRPLNYK